MGNTITDSEKMKELLNALNMSAHSLSVKLEYKSPASVYHVLNGVNTMSNGMARRIVDYIPNVNLEFLKNAKLPVILSGNELEMQMNVLNKTDENKTSEFYMFKRLMEVPSRLDNIEKMLQEIIDNK